MTTSVTLEEVIAEEERLVLTHFDYATAWTLGAKIQEIAAREGLPVAIEISHNAAPVFFCLMQGATPDNAEWIRRKRAVVLRFHHSSLYMRLLCESRDINFHARYTLSPSDYVASGGAVPLRVAGAGVIGVAAVSGLPDVADHRLIVRALTELGLVSPADLSVSG